MPLKSNSFLLISRNKNLGYVANLNNKHGCFFSVSERIFKNDRKRLRLFGENVGKGSLVNTVTVSFNTITGRTTEMYQ